MEKGEMKHDLIKCSLFAMTLRPGQCKEPDWRYRRWCLRVVQCGSACSETPGGLHNPLMITTISAVFTFKRGNGMIGDARPGQTFSD
ncbi:unnamed protein product [Coregonus sp. 'balchen']|nr:unnamed protein product [Coregonus sp. 'balchen']